MFGFSKVKSKVPAPFVLIAAFTPNSCSPMAKLKLGIVIVLCCLLKDTWYSPTTKTSLKKVPFSRFKPISFICTSISIVAWSVLSSKCMSELIFFMKPVIRLFF